MLLKGTALAVLTKHYQNEKALCSILGSKITDDDLVFNSTDRKPLLPNTVTHAWSKIAQKVGLDGVRLRDARHSHATTYLKQGIHPKIVQERLGHSSVVITLDMYSHVTPSLQEDAAKAFDTAFSEGMKGASIEEANTAPTS